MLYEPLANLLSVTEVQCIFFMYCWLPLWRKNSLYFKFNLNFLVHKGYLKNDNVGSFALFHKEFRFVKETRQIYSRFSRDVTAAMLVYRTIAKKVFWEFDSIIMQNLSDILPLFCTPTWPSHHVSENQEYHCFTLNTYGHCSHKVGNEVWQVYFFSLPKKSPWMFSWYFKGMC